MGALRSDGVNDVVSLASAITIASLGTQAWTFRYRGNITAPTGTTAIAGTSSSSTVAGPAVSTTGQLIIRSSANVTVATSPAGFVIFGQSNTYECDHAAGGAISWKRNGIEIGTGSYTGGASWTNINQFFRATSSATSRLQADTEFIEFVGTVNANKWDADLSGGVGDIFPTTSGTNQGTLLNFPTDGSQWVGFGGTDAIVDLIKTTITTISKSISLETGASVSVVKSLSTISSKTLQSVADAKVNFIKSNPIVVAKLLVGQTDSSVNASVDLLKSTQTIASKLLVSTADAYAFVQKSQQSVLAKTFGVTADANVNLSKSVLTVVGKLLIGSTESSIDAVVSISKGSVVIRQITQNLKADANADFVIAKAVVKEYDVQVKSDNFVNIQKGTLLVVGKMLSVGRAPSPVGIDRIFAIEVDEKIFSVINEQMIFAVEREQTIFTLEK